MRRVDSTLGTQIAGAFIFLLVGRLARVLVAGNLQATHTHMQNMHQQPQNPNLVRLAGAYYVCSTRYDVCILCACCA